MSETSMKAGTIRRPITRADESEVRRRVAMALEIAQADVTYLGWDDRDGRLRAIGVQGYMLGASRIALLVGAGLHMTDDGWEIEVRRELPAPWRWHPIGAVSVALCRSFNDAAQQRWIASASDAGAAGVRWYVLDAPGSPGIAALNVASSLAEARERAEDECWARGLLGAVEDAPPVKPDATPPVDRAQAIRDALLAAFERSPGVGVDAVRVMINGRHGAPCNVDTIRAYMASIGAVASGSVWRLSDGPPPGWEWRDGSDDARYLVPSGWTNLRADYIAWVASSGRVWRVCERGIDGRPSAIGKADDVRACEADALMSCRRAGLFAPVEQADEEPSFPTDAGVDRGAPELDARVSAVEAQVATLVQSVAKLEGEALRVREERNAYRIDAGKLREQVGTVSQERDADRATIADIEAQVAGLVGRLAAMTAERDAARVNENDAGQRIAQMETLLARVTEERNEARLNVVDARTRLATTEKALALATEERNGARESRDTWRTRAVAAETKVTDLRSWIAAMPKAVT